MKVQNYLQIPTAFSGSTTPTLDTVNNIIERKEEELERRTGNAWKTQRSYEEYPVMVPRRHALIGRPIYLKHRMVKALSATAGDTFTVWNGSSNYDWIANKTEGRASDFWLDYQRGILFIKTWPARKMLVRITYRHGGIDTAVNDASHMLIDATSVTVDSTANFPYQGTIRVGDEEVTYTGLTSTTLTGLARGANDTTAAQHNDNTPIYLINQDVEDLCTKMVCLELIKSDDRSVILSESGANLSLPQKAEILEGEIERKIRELQEFPIVDTTLGDSVLLY